MAEKPILFSGPMVRAILDGRKTQTRRVIKQQPRTWCGDVLGQPVVYAVNDNGDADPTPISCPYGVPGDRLWVRETHQVAEKNKRLANWETGRGLRVIYTATDGREELDWEDEDRDPYAIRPSIFMPRWASRITLKVTDVRAQRVQDIPTEDVIAEGVDVVSKLPVFLPQKLTGTQLDDLALKIAQAEFKTIWDSINAKRGYGWDENPWVWAITFKRIKPKG